MQKKVGILKLYLVFYLFLVSYYSTVLYFFPLDLGCNMTRTFLMRFAHSIMTKKYKPAISDPHQTLQITDSMKCAFCPPSRKAAVCTAASRPHYISFSRRQHWPALLNRQEQWMRSLSAERRYQTHRPMLPKQQKMHLITSGPQEQTCIKRSQRCTWKDVHTRQKTTRILPQWKKDLNLFVCSFWTVA